MTPPLIIQFEVYLLELPASQSLIDAFQKTLIDFPAELVAESNSTEPLLDIWWGECGQLLKRNPFVHFLKIIPACNQILEVLKGEVAKSFASRVAEATLNVAFSTVQVRELEAFIQVRDNFHRE